MASPSSNEAFQSGPGQDEELERMGFFDHLEELQGRLLRAGVAYGIAFALCSLFAASIYEFLAHPIYQLRPDEELIFLGVTDPFVLYAKVAALAAVFVTAPYIFYQIWAFFSPGLYRRERWIVGPFIVCGSCLFLAGGAFAYYWAFPLAMDVFLQLGARFEAQITVDRYLSFLMKTILWLGLMFELPVLTYLITKMGLVTPRFLRRHVRSAVFLIFLISALVTPTYDVFNLILFALPTVLLYVLGVGVVSVLAPRTHTATE